MIEQASETLEAHEYLVTIVDSGNAEHLAAFVQLLAPGEVAYTIHQLDDEKQKLLFTMLAEEQPELAASIIEHFADEHAADLIEDLEPHQAAAIVDELPSDDQADILADIHEDDAQLIIEAMDPEEAKDVKERLQYEEDTAGGLMITEYLAYNREQRVDDVIADLRSRVHEDDDLEVRYLYVTDDDGKLVGVVKLRTLVLAAHNRKLTDLMVTNPHMVDVTTHIDTLDDLFDRFFFAVLPVVDDQGRLVGVVQEMAVEEALGERADENLMKFGGIIGGEELRSMPVFARAVRRLAFLIPLMFLLMVSAAVIALFEPTVEKLPILAAFLPVVAGLCGSGGTQAMAVSMREISLGLIKSSDLFKVVFK
ncbi:MAG: CBS domain-containing protein, partial [Firmicutes bacterium]|nr:CBS domain-containing protein [Bacillota bacterium]